MCIMAQPVRSVSNTRIFLGRNASGTRQLTIYEMAVQLHQLTNYEKAVHLQGAQRQRLVGGAVVPPATGNAMILPVPAATPADVELIDMSKLHEFFDSIDRVFANPQGYRSRGLTLSKGGVASYLEVHEVGNYQVSIADNLTDLDRLNPEVFTLSPAAQQALGPNYSRLDGPKYVFVVAQLKQSGKFHPLAYTHPLPLDDGKLFVPTRHEHGHGGYAGRLDPSDAKYPKADWDHHIYHQSYKGDFEALPAATSEQLKELRTMRKALGRQSAPETLPRWAEYTAETVPELAPYLNDLNLVRTQLEGRLRNMDLWLEL